ncbi:MAG: hypothetical protein COA79_18015 [Planctomycetota bacterium]|nr:MAG: hypothetical protein COA79_18015 [Planctomycetota bacterium]
MGSKYLLTAQELASISGANLSKIKNYFGFENQKNPKLSSAQVHEFMKKSGFKYTCRSLAFINLKGGVGKTTAAITLASRAVQFGFKTCILDLDAQGSATLALDYTLEEDDQIFHNIWQTPKEINNALIEMEENFFLLPSDLENSLLDVSLNNPASQKKAVKGIINELKNLKFDLILIDCPPSLGAAVISSICAVDEIIIPVANDAFSFKGIELTIEEVGEIRSTFGLSRSKTKILSNMVDKRLNLAKEYEQKLKKKFGKYLMPCCIRTSSDFSKALEKRETVFANNRKSNGKMDYDLVARTIFGLGKK